jgi:CubicO group peptidase (beta-lactamase class C family)
MMRLAQRIAMLDSSMERHGFSGVVSIRQQGRVLYERAAGFADRSNHIRNTLETRFGIASGTKFFTALAIGKLIAAQKLTFSTRLKDCLTLSFPYDSPDITIQHLLTHTSGIPDYYDEEQVTDFNNFTVSRPWYELKGPRDYLAVFPHEPMKFMPGTRFSYSNGGYILLGMVIEELTGLQYQDYVEGSIFKATGMQRSGYFAFNQLPENTALGYIEEAGGWRTNIYNLPIVGASDGGAYATIEDLAILWKAFWENRILPGELVEIYATPHVKAETEGEHTYCGYGLWIDQADAQLPEVYITGCDAGVSFWSGVQRDADLHVTLISNTTDGAWPILRDIKSAWREES